MSLPLSTVYRSLAAYHRAGVPWPEALESATDGEAWRPAVEALRRGVAPAEALTPLVPPLDVAGLRAAETSGRMEEALASLASLHEEEDRRRRERRTALLYPLFLAHIGAVLLPVPDLVAGRVGRGLLWSLLVLVPVYAALLFGRLARRGGVLVTRAGVEEADARALRGLGWLHEAGVPFGTALPLAARAGAGGRVARDLDRAAQRVSDGLPIAGAWRETPPEVAAALTTGETTGTLADALERSASSLDESAVLRRRRLAAVLPPVVVLGVGLVVAWRVISFYAGYFSRYVG
jgi:type II secretory pathway component PulF